MKLSKLRNRPLNKSPHIQERRETGIKENLDAQPVVSKDEFQSQEFDGELAFYEGMATSGRFVTGMAAAGAAVVASLGTGLAFSAAVAMTPGLTLAGIGAAAGLGVGGYFVGTALSDAVGIQGSNLDQNFPERGEAFARTGLAVGLNALSGGVGGALGTAGLIWGEGLLTETVGKVKHRLGRGKRRLMATVEQYKQSQH